MTQYRNREGWGSSRRLTASNNNQHDRQTKWFSVAAHPHRFPSPGINQPTNCALDCLGLFVGAKLYDMLFFDTFIGFGDLEKISKTRPPAATKATQRSQADK
jgi:hypothetical protein